MKLLRLTTDNENANFNNILNEDLRINKNSSVALNNVSLEINRSEIEINLDNDEVTCNFISTKPDMTALLENATYTIDNYEILLEDIQNTLNKSMPLRGDTIGRQWKAYLQDQIVGKKVYIEQRLAPYIEPETTKYYKSKNISRTESTPGVFTYKRDGGVVGNLDSYFYLNKPVSLGAGILRSTINQLGSGSDGLILGFLDINPDTKTFFTLADIKYGARIIDNKIYMIKNGVEATDAESIASNTVGGVVDLFTADNLGLNIYKGGVITNADIIDKIFDDFYPIVFFKDSTTEINNVRVTLDPYQTDPVTQGTTHNDSGLTYPTPPVNYQPTDNNILKFESISLANFLGFNNSSYGPYTAINYIYKAENLFNLVGIPESLLVLIDSLSLDSYDTFTNKRESIVAIITNVEAHENRVIFQAPQPLFISINNDSPRNIRNIKARILNIDYSPIEIEGLATMTLLFQ